MKGLANILHDIWDILSSLAISLLSMTTASLISAIYMALCYQATSPVELHSIESTCVFNRLLEGVETGI